MTKNKMGKATNYKVIEYNYKGNIIDEKYFPKHIYSFEDVVNSLNGDLTKYDIEQGRFSKRGLFWRIKGYWTYSDNEWIKHNN